MDYFAKWTPYAFLGVALLVGHPAAYASGQKPATEPSYKYDTPGTQLNGTLIERKVYGPPGYGETPSKDTQTNVLILKVLHGITVEPTATAETNGSANLDPANNVREVQLFISRSQMADSRKLIGREVIVTGTLNESMTASQYTKVWLDVKTLEPK